MTTPASEDPVPVEPAPAAACAEEDDAMDADPDDDAAPAAPHRRLPTPGQLFGRGLLLPPLGLIYGLSRAFHRDPSQRRLASSSLTGAVAGVCLWLLIGTSVYPALMEGQGQAAYEAGVQANLRRDLVAAEAAFREAVARDPNFAAAWINLAGVLLQQRNATEAEPAARRAVELADQGRQTRIPRGSSLQQMRAEAHGNLAGCMALQYDWPAAAREARVALNIAPSHPFARNWRMLTVPERLEPAGVIAIPGTVVAPVPGVDR